VTLAKIKNVNVASMTLVALSASRRKAAVATSNTTDGRKEMIKVKLARFDWDFLLYLLEQNPGYVSSSLLTDIQSQVDSQEN